MKKNKGVSMISLVITIVVIIILSAVALSNSTSMIENSSVAITEADKMEDNEKIRALVTYGITDRSARMGIALSDSTNVVIGKNGTNYGNGYHLIVGGTEETIKEIEEKTRLSNLKAYKDITAPYVVNYDTSDYERLDEIKFK